VSDGATHHTLEALVRRLGRSLLQYLSEAYPWTTTSDSPILSEVKRMAEEERDLAAKLSRFLAMRRHTVAYLGAFPSSFTTLNFVALEFVLPKLVQFERSSLEALEKDLAALKDQEARKQAENILTLQQRHLHELEALAASHTKLTSTVR